MRWHSYSKANLMCVNNDQMAGILPIHVDDVGKLNDRAAKWLGDRIATAPLML